jgi:hypothetical protein
MPSPLPPRLPPSLSACVASDRRTANTSSVATPPHHNEHLVGGFILAVAGQEKSFWKSRFCDSGPLTRNLSGLCSSVRMAIRIEGSRSLSHQFCPYDTQKSCRCHSAGCERCSQKTPCQPQGGGLTVRGGCRELRVREASDRALGDNTALSQSRRSASLNPKP